MNEQAFLEILQNHWDEFVGKGEKMTFQKGQNLFYQDHYPYGLFVLCRGQVYFASSLKSGEFGKLSPVPEGEILELASWLEGKALGCTATAATDCEVLFFSNTDLKNLLSPFLQGERLAYL